MTTKNTVNATISNAVTFWSLVTAMHLSAANASSSQESRSNAGDGNESVESRAGGAAEPDGGELVWTETFEAGSADRQPAEAAAPRRPVSPQNETTPDQSYQCPRPRLKVSVFAPRRFYSPPDPFQGAKRPCYYVGTR